MPQSEHDLSPTGAIYAPDATLTIKGDGDLWGAVTAKQIVSVGDLKLHLDQAIIPQTRGQRVEFRLRHWFHSL